MDLAELLAIASRNAESVVDRQRRLWLGRLCSDPAGQAFVSAVADRAHRSNDTARTADTVRWLIQTLGVPRFLPAAARPPFALAGSRVLPSAVLARAVRFFVRTGATGLVHDDDPATTRALVAARQAQATEVNLNLVGEVVLGEDEARRRHEAYVEMIRTTDARAISIKLSSIASQVSLAGFEASVDMLLPRLTALYTEAQRRSPHVLVNLDMEAFDDLELTLALHRRVVADPALRDLTTGVVLQAYLPDAHARYEALLADAHERHAAGVAPLRVRLVKGANLSMERHLAALRGHPLPIYPSKADTDASWLALVERACAADNARVLNVGVASHNLFDLAFALVVRAEQGSEASVQLELLEGMADPLRRVLATLAGPVLVYAPVVAPGELDAAIAYLVRRLEEATAPEHFLPVSFTMEPGDDRYQAERARFAASAEARFQISTQSRRAHPAPLERSPLDAPFTNEPDTDWAVRSQREAILRAVATLEASSPADIVDVCSVVGGRDHDGVARPGADPSRPGLVAYRVLEADHATVEHALMVASQSSWRRVPARERAELLADVAHGLRRARPQLVATMVLDGGKRVTEADAEVSEAIDFAEYYARSLLELDADQHICAEPLGTVVVASPWNFPLAIAAGGVLGALAGGNAVILKPSPKTPLVARELVRVVHAAGIPTDALSLLVIPDRLATALVRDERTHAVVLTGSTATARKIRSLRPRLPLFAETGGKNALIVTAAADRDLAIRDALSAAFGHAGQKCSATSLLICEGEVYDDPEFRRRLVDATTSLGVGSAWQPIHVVTPLIEPASGPLAHALRTLDAGESWLLRGEVSAENSCLLSPSIKLGVQPGSFTHQTELFGPLLGVMRAESLDDAITLASGTPYGLTGALHSLDPREQARWLERIEVGNAYVNRGTTGAIVRRQPFGGTKASCFGPGAKAGGAAYVRQLVRLADRERGPGHVDDEPRAKLNSAVARWLESANRVLDPSQLQKLERVAAADAKVFAAELVVPRDPSAIATQRNLAFHVPRRGVTLVVQACDQPFHVLRELIAASTVGAGVTLAHSSDETIEWVTALGEGLFFLPSEESALAERLTHGRLRTLRTTSAPSEALARAAVSLSWDLRVLDRPPLEDSYSTLTYWMEERSVTIEDHRYGQALPSPLRVASPRLAHPP